MSQPNGSLCSILSKLKRRKVFWVAGVYAIVGFGPGRWRKSPSGPRSFRGGRARRFHVGAGPPNHAMGIGLIPFAIPLAAVLVSAAPLPAQRHIVHTYAVADGLPSSHVLCLVKLGCGQ